MPARGGVPWVFKWVDAVAQQVGGGEQQQDEGASKHLRSAMGKEPACLRVPATQPLTEWAALKAAAAGRSTAKAGRGLDPGIASRQHVQRAGLANLRSQTRPRLLLLQMGRWPGTRQ